MVANQKFSMGDKVVYSTFTDFDPPYDKITEYGVIVGFYYQDCVATFEQPLNYNGWVYIVKIYKQGSLKSDNHLDLFSEDEITLQPALRRVK